MAWSAETACCAWGGGQLSVSSGVLVTAVPLPEWSFAGALGVVVGWGGAVALFFLVVTDEDDLENGCYDKEEAGISVSGCLDLKGGKRCLHGNYRDGEDCSLERASTSYCTIGARGTISQRRIDIS
jgi:hypothetical protein